MTRTKKRYFTIEHLPAADGAVWTVFSPEGTSVYRTDSIEEARAYQERRNTAVENKALADEVRLAQSEGNI